MKVIFLIALLSCSNVFNIKIKSKNYNDYLLGNDIGNSAKFVESIFSDSNKSKIKKLKY
jgi:hypothetical protein